MGNNWWIQWPIRYLVTLNWERAQGNMLSKNNHWVSALHFSRCWEEADCFELASRSMGIPKVWMRFARADGPSFDWKLRLEAEELIFRPFVKDTIEYWQYRNFTPIGEWLKRWKDIRLMARKGRSCPYSRWIWHL